MASPKVFSMEVVGKGNVSKQAEVVEPGFRGKERPLEKSVYSMIKRRIHQGKAKLVQKW